MDGCLVCVRFQFGTGWDFLAHLPACPTLLASADVLPCRVKLQSLLLSLLTVLICLDSLDQVYVRPERWHGGKTPEARLGDRMVDQPSLGYRSLHNHCWRDASCLCIHHLMDCF